MNYTSMKQGRQFHALMLKKTPYKTITNTRFNKGMMIHDSKENAPGKDKGTASAADKPGRPQGTPRTGIPVLCSERQAETIENVGHYLHLGTREGAGPDYRLTPSKWNRGTRGSGA
jgi:hypothetical protein